MRKCVKAVRLIWIADELRRVVAAALLPFLLVISFATCAGIVSAQTPPFTVTAAVTPLGIQVTFTACQSSTDGNCVYPFSIYRSPQPGFNQSPIGYASLGSGGNSYTGVYNDQKFNKGVGYTYEVCSGSAALSDRSNCTKPTPSPVTVSNTPPAAPQPTVKLFYDSTSVGPSGGAVLGWTSTNATSLDLEPGVGKVAGPTGSANLFPKQTTTYTITATGPGGTASASAVVCGPMAPTQNLSLAPYWTALKWTNPNQTCQTKPTDILIYRWTPSSNWSQHADLPAENGILPSRYVDPEILPPHSPFQYQVCQGPSNGSGVNCASSGLTYVWGASPVLTAVAMSTTSVKLEVAVDDATDIETISVTRGVIDSTCGQGKQLGNGLQGCSTVTTAPNGVATPLNAGPTITVYNWRWPGPGSTPSKSNSAPYIIDIPDDTTVKPGVEYFYQAEVVYDQYLHDVPLSQYSDNAVVTVPTVLQAAASQQILAGGLKPLKLSGGAPPPSQSGATARPTMAPTVRAASPMMCSAGPATAPPPSPSRVAAAPLAKPTSRTVTPTPASPMTNLAGSTTEAPPRQPVIAATPIMAPITTQATPMLQPGRPMMSSTGAAAAPPPAQSSTAARLTVQPMTAPPSRTTLPVRSAVPSPEATNLNAALKEVQQKPHDAQALYALGKAYCESRMRDTGVSYLYMALRLAERACDAPLASQIKTSLAGQGVNPK